MGLDTSHNCWHGAYSAFMRWRKEIAKIAGFPPLELMEGFYEPLKSTRLPTLYFGMDTRKENYLDDIDAALPIKWECLKQSPIFKLLYHSDCEGEIESADCGPIADALEALLPLFPDGDGGGHIGNWRDKTATFIAGLRLAASKGENVDFH